MRSANLFAANLATACEGWRSISELCRELSINRQQFNRYLHEGVMPSAHNRSRIASAFGLNPADFLLPPREFAARLERPRSAALTPGTLADGFPGDLTALRRYCGYYQTYHLSMSWPGRVACSCTRLTLKDGAVETKSLERFFDPQHAIRQISRYVGMAAWWRGRMFIIERATGADPMLAQTTLTPFEAHQRSYLKGVTMGVAWRRENLPYASRIIWRWKGTAPNLRELVGQCGLYEPTDRRLPEPVSRFLGPDDGAIVSI